MIYSKLAEIQKELFVPKGQTNDFGGYAYRSCEDILKAVKPICEAKGCVLHITNNLQLVGDWHYVEAVAVLTDIETGESVSATAQAREEIEKKKMDASQITGAASSYARKYALAGLFCIDNEKDSDATNDHGNSKPTTRRQETPDEAKKNEAMRNSVDKDLVPTGDKPTAAQMKKLHAEMERTGIDATVVLSLVSAEKLEDLTQAQVIAVLNKFAKTKDKAK